MDHPRTTIRRSRPTAVCRRPGDHGDIGARAGRLGSRLDVPDHAHAPRQPWTTTSGSVSRSVASSSTRSASSRDCATKRSSSRHSAEPDVPYTITVTVGKGEALDYSISKMWLHEAHTLWINTLVGDGRDHTLSYVYLFDLPATDTLPPGPGPVTRLARQPL